MKAGRIIIFFILLVWPASSHAITATEIMQKADRLRTPSFRDFSMDVDIQSPGESLAFRLYLRMRDCLVVYRAPEHERGKVLLLNEGTIWMFTEHTRRGVLMTQLLRLHGAINLGDILLVRFDNGYDVNLEGEDAAAYHITMTAQNSSISYHRIEAVIEKGSFKPVSLRVYLKSGKLFRTIFFEGYTLVSGEPMVTRIRFVDHLRNDETAVMSFSNIQPTSLPAEYFNRGTLPGLIKKLNRM